MTNSDPKPDPPSQAKGIVPDPAKTWIAHLDTLQQALDVDVPYTCGVLPVADPHTLYLYFKMDDEGNTVTSFILRFIDFGNAQEEHLIELAAACQKATFGLNQTNVLDKTYHKADKLNLDQFSAQLDVIYLMDKTWMQTWLLLQNCPGSFFKAHKDTLCAENMIGSLVVVFHTPHKGGELTLGHGDNTEKFDSAVQLTTQADSHAIAYVAFYSVVVHAVEPVSSGYC
ncbi:hypothetical protein B0H14DRAFT_2593427 [Mycena olivaceomarginata]|nr:hypothetical protein B0H14DRAFT_2593427 [Mycena olivaceomarginata]